MATNRLSFREEDMVVDEGLGYPKAYAKLCRDPNLNLFRHGPPFTFVPYSLQAQQALREQELDEMFPITNPDAKPSTKPKVYASLLWKQLNHLGNAGFDPAQFRVDPYGNVLYCHADSASPLAWEIDHWFPCSRGGLTVPSNLRLLQWQVCKKKHNKLDLLVPWWDLQLGISVNQFLSMFATSNSDFRNRAFSLLFFDGENEELNTSQTVESHTFPQHFLEAKQKVGLAPAAIVLCRKEPSDASSVLRSINLNRQLRSNSPANSSRKLLVDENDSYRKSIQMLRPSFTKENDNASNPYLAIAMARDSLRQKEDMQAEIHKLDDELEELQQKNELERVAIQDLEMVLIKRRRRAEKCRRLAEAQSSYKALLEKMIRDAMHQSVIYKEQARLNQSATSALMARLEAQKAICDSSERDLHRKFKQKGEIEEQIMPQWGQARKRSRIDDGPFEEREDKSILYLPGVRTMKSSVRTTKPQKELRVFLEEEQKRSEAGLSPIDERDRGENNELVISEHKTLERDNTLVVLEHETPIEDMLHKLEIEEKKKTKSATSSVLQSPEREEDEECRNQRGKGNVEKWLQMLLANKEDAPVDSPDSNTYEDQRNNQLLKKLNLKNNPQKEIKILKFPASDEEKGGAKREPEIVEERYERVVERKDNKLVSDRSCSVGRGIVSRKSCDEERKERNEERRERNEREKELFRSESARAFRPIPYSPSAFLARKKGVDCIGKKPIVIGSDEDTNEAHVPGNRFMKSSFKTIKKAVKM